MCEKQRFQVILVHSNILENVGMNFDELTMLSEGYCLEKCLLIDAGQCSSSGHRNTFVKADRGNTSMIGILLCKRNPSLFSVFIFFLLGTVFFLGIG